MKAREGHVGVCVERCGRCEEAGEARKEEQGDDADSPNRICLCLGGSPAIGGHIAGTATPDRASRAGDETDDGATERHPEAGSAGVQRNQAVCCEDADIARGRQCPLSERQTDGAGKCDGCKTCNYEKS